MTENDDSKQAVATLKAKRQWYLNAIQGIDIAIAALEGSEVPAMVDAAAITTQAPIAPKNANADVSIRSDSFWMMSMSDAARKFLDMVKRPQSVNVIGEALKKGGYLSESPNYLSMVRNTLRTGRAFTKVNSDWGLREWYAGRSLPTEPTVKLKAKAKKKRVGNKTQEKSVEIKAAKKVDSGKEEATPSSGS